MISEKREKLKQELEKNIARIQEAKIRLEQLDHQMERLNMKKDFLDQKKRKARAHRLITKGAAVESIFPETKELGEKLFYNSFLRFFSEKDHRKEIALAIEAEKHRRKDIPPKTESEKNRKDGDP